MVPAIVVMVMVSIIVVMVVVPVIVVAMVVVVWVKVIPIVVIFRNIVTTICWWCFFRFIVSLEIARAYYLMLH